VVEIQIAPIKSLAAILAHVLVALENIVPRKLHFFLRQPIEEEQHDYARHSNLPRNRRDHFVIWRSRREIAPTLEIVRQEIVCFVGRNNVRVAGVNQRERAPRRADVDRLPETIQH